MFGLLSRVTGRKEREPDIEFVVFDLETTGLSPKRNAIIEIGAIHYTHGQDNHRSFQSFVDPGKPIPKKISKLTGITDDMVTGADGPEVALREFLKFVGGCTLVAYNASFDMGFLRHHGGKHGLDVDIPAIDALRSARRAWPDLPNHKLATVAKHLDIDVGQSHRALDDCLTTLHVYAQSTFMGK